MSCCHSEGFEFKSWQRQIFFIIENKVTESMTMLAPSGEQIKSLKSYMTISFRVLSLWSSLGLFLHTRKDLVLLGLSDVESVIFSQSDYLHQSSSNGGGWWWYGCWRALKFFLAAAAATSSGEDYSDDDGGRDGGSRPTIFTITKPLPLCFFTAAIGR